LIDRPIRLGGDDSEAFLPNPCFRAVPESVTYACRARRDALSKLKGLPVALKRPSVPADVRAADHLQPPTAKVALHRVLGEIVGDLAKAPKEAGSIGEAAHR
jgi:hypothetical protein